jgi:hypothetical protein
LVATGNSATVTYNGASQSVSGFTLVGLQGSDTAADLLTVSATGASGQNAGSYTNTVSAGTEANYTVSTVNGSLSIAKANATVTANSSSLTYSGANQSVTGFTATGLVGGETEAVLVGVSASRTAKNAGTYAVTPSGTASNYNLSFVDGSMQIAKANATVTANSASVTYNGANQTVSGFTATGLVGGETEAVLTGVSASRTAKNAGNYAVAASGTDGNYNLSFVNGSLDIAKSALTATGNSSTVTYNGANQSVGGFTVTGLQGSDTVADLSNVVAAGATAKNAGSYANTVTAGTETNYTVSTLPGSLDIAKANATVTANNATRTYDGSAYTGGNGVAYAGFVNNETEAVLGGTLGYIGTSQGARNAGSYVITPAGLTSSNYAVNFANGTLTISPAGVSAIAVNLTGSTTKVYDGTTAATLTPGNFALTGFVAGEGASVSKTTGTFDNANAGTGKTVTATLSSSDFAATGTTQLSNYTLPTSASGAIGSITPAPLNATLTGSITKVNDGSTAATLAPGNFALTGFVNAEGASVSKTSGTYDTASEGTGKTVTTTLSSGDFAATGATQLSNYTLPTSASGAIGAITPVPAPPAPEPPAPVTPAPVTPAPVTPAPVTPAPVIPEPVKPEPVTPEPVKPEPVTPTPAPAPVTPTPAPAAPVVVVIPPAVPAVSAQSVAPPRLTISTGSSATSALPSVSARPSSAAVSSGSSSSSSSSSGVSVSTINAPSVQMPGLVTVLVPAGTATAGSGLVIALPEQVVTPAAAGGTVQVTLPNNQPLPDWIRYDAATQTLVTSAVPAGAFPLSVVVTVGGQSTVIQISESQSSL